MMKKVLFMLITIFVMLFTVSFSTFATKPELPEVYVTISNSKGELVLCREKIILDDVDKDGALTINDALYIAHENKYAGGAEAGYAYYLSDFGLSLSKLWGEATSAIGYCVNNISAMSLADTVQAGDHIKAYVYQDQVAYSDIYCYFDKQIIETIKGEEVTLVLYGTGYDENWQPVVKVITNATIIINDKNTEYKTNDNGEVTFIINEKGLVNISAKSETNVLVPPICQAEVITESNTAAIIACAVVAVIVLSGLVGTIVIKKKNENI